MRLKKTFFAIVLGLFFCCLTGCEKEVVRVPSRLEVVSGAEQLAPCGAKCEAPLAVKVFGSSGKHSTVADIRVCVEPVTAGCQVTPQTVLSDDGGRAVFQLQLAKKFGDQYFRVFCPDYAEVKPVLVHAIAGVSIENGSQETVAGNFTDRPMEVTVTDEEGRPAAHVPVFFSLKSGDPGARLNVTQVLTDAAGKARLEFQTAAGYTGKYEILAEVGSGERRTRGIVIPVLGICRLNLFLGVLGGLGFFIFGMTLMSDGLQQAAGDRLKNLLQMCTSNRFNAMLAGVLVTALVQSSSACSVMVIGFVNASLLNLSQAIGIILGSSIGTTITAQIISFKLDFLALPAVALGVFWLLLAKKIQSKAIASTLLGFGILFFGMTLMSSQLKSIGEFPTFISFFNRFDCTPAAGHVAPPLGAVIGAIVVGTVMTMIVQSSAATIGIAIALAETGLLNLYTAVPLILGDNIGTTITGLLASINTSRPSRQTAIANTIFKVLGVLIMIPIFYIPWDGVPCFLKLVDLTTAGDVFAAIPENLGRHMASAHTLFNILNVAIFLPLTGMIAWLSRLLVPERRSGDEANAPLVHLEVRLLRTPSAALTQVLVALETMADAAMEMTTRALQAVRSPEKGPSREDVGKMENRVDQAQKDIIDYLVALTRSQLNVSQSKTIPLFMHCVNDLERIGDRACNVFDLVPSGGAREAFSEDALKDIREIEDLLTYMHACLLRGLRHNDVEAIQKVLKLEGEAKHMTARFEQGHEDRLRKQACTVEKGLAYIEILANLERIASHLTNVADRAPQLLPYSLSLTQQE